jgi:general secretion pathway protein K
LHLGIYILTPFAAHELSWRWAITIHDHAHVRLSLVRKAAVKPLITALRRAGNVPAAMRGLRRWPIPPPGTRVATPRASTAKSACAEQGFALLIVLWTLSLLSFLVSQMTTAARTEASIAVNLRRDIITEADVDGAIHVAAFHLLDRSDTSWTADGTVHEIAVPGGRIAVRVTDEADKVNLNTASADMLRAALLGVGADPKTATGLAGAIVDWRGTDGPTPSVEKVFAYRASELNYAPPEKPFRDLDELALVPGMTQDLLTKIRPHLTIYSTYGPARSSIDPVAQGAVMLLRKQGGILPYEQTPSGEQVVRIVAIAEDGKGAPFSRSAILRLDPGAKDRPFAILEWKRGT